MPPQQRLTFGPPAAPTSPALAPPARGVLADGIRACRDHAALLRALLADLDGAQGRDADLVWAVLEDLDKRLGELGAALARSTGSG